MSRRRLSDAERRFDVVVGQRILLTRKALRMTAKELAASIGISAQNYYSYESGRTSCPTIVLAKIAAHLGVSVTAIIPKINNNQNN